MRKKYSIIIPVYNTEKFIKKCLDSVKNQTYDNYEVIIVNDGSTDNSLKIIKEYTKDNRFKVYSKKNGGLSSARNHGLKYVTGDYIVFLDSDDFWNKDLLLKLSEIKNDYEIIRFKGNVVDEEGNIIRPEKNKLNEGKVTIDQLINLEFFEGPPIYTYKRDFFINNKFKYEEGKLFEDYGLVPLCLAKAKKIYMLDYYGYNYVQRKSSISYTTHGTRRMDDILFHYKKLLKIIDKDKTISKHNREVIKKALAVRLIYTLRYVPLNKVDEYIEKIKETDVYEYITGNSFKMYIIRNHPKLYSLIIRIKENVIKKISPKLLLTIYLIVNIMHLFIGTYMVNDSYLTIDTFSIENYYLLFVNVMIILFMILKHKYKSKKVDALFLLAILLGVISTIFAFDVNVSINGTYNRNEGLLHICYYISLIILSSYIEKEKYKKYLIYSIILTGIFQFGYGFIQVTDSYKFLNIVETTFDAAKGTISNPNFYGTYMILCLLFVVGFFIDEKRRPKQLIYYLLSIIFVIGLLISNALSCILSYIIVLTVLIIYLIIKKKYLKTGLLILGFVIPLFIFTELDLTYAEKDLLQTKDEIVEITQGNMDDKFGTDRMYLWKKTVKIIPDHFWNGVGIDNFLYAFDGKSLPVLYDKNTVYDKAHNEYLQILITQGIFALLCWLGIYLLIVNEGLIYFFKENKTYLLLPVIGYLIQANFNISVIEVAPIFYIALGLCINRNNIKTIN